MSFLHAVWPLVVSEQGLGGMDEWMHSWMDGWMSERLTPSPVSSAPALNGLFFFN